MSQLFRRLLPHPFQAEEETQIERITQALIVFTIVVLWLAILSAWSLNNLGCLRTVVTMFLSLAFPLWFLYRGRLFLSHLLIAIIAYPTLTLFLGFIMQRRELMIFVSLTLLSIGLLAFGYGLASSRLGAFVTILGYLLVALIVSTLIQRFSIWREVFVSTPCWEVTR